MSNTNVETEEGYRCEQRAEKQKELQRVQNLAFHDLTFASRKCHAGQMMEFYAHPEKPSQPPLMRSDVSEDYRVGQYQNYLDTAVAQHEAQVAAVDAWRTKYLQLKGIWRPIGAECFLEGPESRFDRQLRQALSARCDRAAAAAH